ncbi:MAG: hypothetical protein AB1757_24140 [Acidobacteriota bacterium]
MMDSDQQNLKLILLERESRRVSHENPREAELASEGWQRRFVADAARAAEVIALYRQLGFEVFAEPVRLIESDEDCDDCRLVMQRDYQTIYTRKRVNHDHTNGNS